MQVEILDFWTVLELHLLPSENALLGQASTNEVLKHEGSNFVVSYKDSRTLTSGECVK